MLYPERNSKGEIVAIHNSPREKGQKPIGEKELTLFLAENDETGSYKSLLSHLDTKMIRVLEDLIDLLVAKNLIMVTDLPEEAQKKIAERKRVRMKMQEAYDLTVDDVV